MEGTTIILVATVAGLCAGGAASAALLWWARARIDRANRNAEMRAVSRNQAAEVKVRELEAQLQRTRDQLEKLRAGTARENQNLVAILRGLTGSSLRVEQRLKELERKAR